MKNSSDFKQRVFSGYIWHNFSSQYPNTVSLPVLIDPRTMVGGSELSEKFKQQRQGDPVANLPEQLFEYFAELHIGDDKAQIGANILEFANTYGFLGVGCGLELSGVPVHAETLNTWWDASSKLYRAKVRHELLIKSRQDDLEGFEKRGAREKLANLYKQDRNDIKYLFRDAPELLQICDRADKESSHFESMTNIEDAELTYVGILVDRKLKRYTSLKLAWDSSAHQLELQYRTETLIGFLWLQFVEHITNLKGFRFCVICHKELQIMNGSRDDKHYCSDRCNKRAKRKGIWVRSKYKGEAAA